MKLVRVMNGERSMVLQAPEMITTGRDLRLCDELADRERGRRDAAEHDIDFLVDDHFLHDAARHIRHAGILAHDQFDLLAGDLVAIDLHIKPRAGQRLAPDRLEAAGDERQAPILMTSCAAASRVPTAVTAVAAAIPFSTSLRSMSSSPISLLFRPLAVWLEI